MNYEYRRQRTTETKNNGDTKRTNKQVINLEFECGCRTRYRDTSCAKSFSFSFFVSCAISRQCALLLGRLGNRLDWTESHVICGSESSTRRSISVLLLLRGCGFPSCIFCGALTIAELSGPFGSSLGSVRRRGARYVL